jgi:hypothetical protein
VRGVVVDDRGQPARGARIALVGVSTGSAGSAAVRQDGSFVLEHVAPGEYHLAAMRTNPASGEQEVVQRTLAAAGSDIDGLTLVLGRGGSVSGVVVTDDGSVPEMAPASLRVRAVPLGGALPVRLASAGSGALGPEWAFELTGVSGAFMLQVQPLPAAWMLKQVLHDGQDVSDTGLSILGTGAVNDVQMVITRRTSGISGAVVDAQDRPVADYTVIAFAEDRARWRPHSRYFAVARPDRQARFDVRNLPPGEYFVAAVDWVEDGTEEDPALLELLRASAVRILLAEGEQRAITLPLTVPRQ